jgi:hypothetical protein
MKKRRYREEWNETGARQDEDAYVCKMRRWSRPEREGSKKRRL